MSTAADFSIGPGERVAFVLSYGASHKPPPAPIDSDKAHEETVAFWRAWASRCTDTGHERDTVIRSLLTLKTMTFAETGAIVAAPTTSLPEQLQGSRNWDYRYCWIRDATLTLTALMGAGYHEEAAAWRDWLHRSLAGSPDDLQIMYGIFGERRLDEWHSHGSPATRSPLPCASATPRPDNFSSTCAGEMMDRCIIRRGGRPLQRSAAWEMQLQGARTSGRHLEGTGRRYLGDSWTRRQQFTHSKVMAWVAFDRAIRSAEIFGLEGPLDLWRTLRDEIFEDVCAKGFDQSLGCFVQSYGSKYLDASLLLIPCVGFLPVSDPRVEGTVAAIERRLLCDGFVMRYNTQATDDGLSPGEGVFLPCSFWLADVFILRVASPTPNGCSGGSWRCATMSDC